MPRSRSAHRPHDGLAAAQEQAVRRVRRLVHLSDGAGSGLDRLRRGLEYRDVEFSVHDVLQEFKTHARAQDPRGRRADRLGAKTITEGGYHALPKRFNAPGLLLAGEGAGLVNVPTLKGIHYAIESGIMAAEAVPRPASAGSRRAAPARSTPTTRSCGELRARGLREVRNMRQVFDKGSAARSRAR